MTAGDATCSAPGCSLPVRCRGLCNAHHRRALRGASLERPVADSPGRPLGPPTHEMHVRVSVAAYEHLEAWAEDSETTPSSIARTILERACGVGKPRVR